MKHFTILVLAGWLLTSGCATTQQNPEATAAAARQAAEVNTSLGREYLSRGQHEVALEKLKKAVKSDDRYAPAHTVLAVLYEQIGEIGLAEEHYQKAVEASPSNGDVNNNYGVFLCQSGRTGEAQKYFERAIDDPFYRTPQVAYANAGSCEFQAGNLDKAEDFLRQSIQYDEEFPDALLPLANISFQKGEFLRARAFLQRFEAAGTESAESLYLGYRIETSLLNEHAARKYAGGLQERFPDSGQLRKLKGTND
jgi:type IV pilus assembly protein PilF